MAARPGFTPLFTAGARLAHQLFYSAPQAKQKSRGAHNSPFPFIFCMLYSTTASHRLHTEIHGSHETWHEIASKYARKAAIVKLRI